jgi:hypothetical protein
MTLARRVAKLEATGEQVPLPDRRVPYAMRVFAEGLVRADRLDGQRRFASLVWAQRGRQDLAKAAGKGDLDAVAEAIATATEAERDGMRAAATVLLKFLEAQAGDAEDRRAHGPRLA